MDKYLKSFVLKLQQLDNKMQTLFSFKKERKLKCYKTTKQIFFIKFLLKYNIEITFIEYFLQCYLRNLIVFKVTIKNLLRYN